MTDRSRIESILAAFPSEGLFRDKEWKLSAEPFQLPSGTLELIQRLGPALRAFQRACNELYFTDGEHAWVAALLDQGKPQDIIDLGKRTHSRAALPSVIRPDLVLTETGVSISELDSLPGGIGLTGWLNQTYAALGENVIGGGSGMIDGFAAAFPTEDILISRESADYEPEMRWMAKHLQRRVLRTDAVSPAELDSTAIYRFFELWDLANVEHSQEWLRLSDAERIRFTPPLKAFLEEKLWLALFWTPQLAAFWRDALSLDHFDLLRKCIPQGWIVDPTPLPPYAERTGLNIHSWDEVKRFGNKARELVLKISGFSEKGWGSRGVTIGHDHPQAEWAKAIDDALLSFPKNPFILQRFHGARVVSHPMWDAASGVSVGMQSRVRLCPYYFIEEGTDNTQLGGVLATVCPADKKILHGMKDAMMLPCVA